MWLLSLYSKDKEVMQIKIVNILGEKMRNIKLEIEYDGKKFGGWQKTA